MSQEPEYQPRVRLLPCLPAAIPPVYLLILVILTYFLLLVVPHIKGIPTEMAVLGGSILFAALALGIVGVGAIWRVPLVDEILLAASMALIWALLNRLPGWTHLSVSYVTPATQVVFLLGCLFLGKIISRIVREASMTLPVCIIAALADIFTVFFGPTGKALENNAEFVQKFSLAIPEAGSAVNSGQLANVSMIGLGDFIFMSLFMALAVRFKYRFIRTFWGMLIGACVGILLTLTGALGVYAMPLLPYIGVGFVAANYRQFKMQPQEWRHFIFGVILFIVMFVGIATIINSK